MNQRLSNKQATNVKYTAAHCNTLQHQQRTATHHNTPQHTATNAPESQQQAGDE